jgi:hypothetical protein
VLEGSGNLIEAAERQRTAYSIRVAEVHSDMTSTRVLAALAPGSKWHGAESQEQGDIQVAQAKVAVLMRYPGPYTRSNIQIAQGGPRR